MTTVETKWPSDRLEPSPLVQHTFRLPPKRGRYGAGSAQRYFMEFTRATPDKVWMAISMDYKHPNYYLCQACEQHGIEGIFFHVVHQSKAIIITADQVYELDEVSSKTITFTYVRSTGKIEDLNYTTLQGEMDDFWDNHRNFESVWNGERWERVRVRPREEARN